MKLFLAFRSLSQVEICIDRTFFFPTKISKPVIEFRYSSLKIHTTLLSELLKHFRHL